MQLLILGLLIFLGLHSLRMVAPAWRDGCVAAMGETRWKGIFALISFIGIGVTIWGWHLAYASAPFFYEPPLWLKHVALLLMLAAFVSASVAVFPAGRLKPRLRHPLLLAVKIWAFAHLLANGDLAALILFGSFLAWAVAARIALKRRNLPAPQPGPVMWDVLAVSAGVAIYALFIWELHLLLFGMVPFA